jgi:hypothetical protein
MNLDRPVLAFAGLVVLISAALGYLASPYKFLLTAFATDLAAGSPAEFLALAPEFPAI